MKRFMLLICLLSLFLSCKYDEYNIENNNLKVVDRLYAKPKGKNEIYFMGESPILLTGADLKTFKAYKKLQKKDEIKYDAKDKNYYYLSGRIAWNKEIENL
ncbi:MAG: hypothetical protein KBF12_10565 [Sebaldella sp.]|nr:hypothetical protein [Sebaldella sp.]